MAFVSSERLSAQEPIGLHVNALTSAERDSVMLRTQRPGDLKLIYACVPAGILVFASDGASATRDALRSEVLMAIAPIVPAERITSNEVTLHAAEAACANERGQ